MSMRIAAALAVALLGLVACEDDGASVRDLGGSASSGSGSGSGSGTGAASGSGTEASAECVEPESGDPALEVRMDEYQITVEETELTSGPTRFLVANLGEDEHELVVVATKRIESLPLTSDGSVNEEKLNPGQLITEVEEIAPGTGCAVEVDLEPGNYALFCNIRERTDEGVVNHFLQGMRTRVKVS